MIITKDMIIQKSKNIIMILFDDDKLNFKEYSINRRKEFALILESFYPNINAEDIFQADTFEEIYELIIKSEIQE